MTHDGHTKFDPQKHHRKSIRLQGYDYAQAGAYFITIVAHPTKSVGQVDAHRCLVKLWMAKCD